MAAPLDVLVQKAEQAHRLARAGPHNESTAFLISTQAGHSPHVAVHPPVKNTVVGKLKNSRGKQSKLSDGAHEAFNVFVSQSWSKPSEKVMKIIQPTDSGLPPLPGGCPSLTIWQPVSRMRVITVTSTLSSSGYVRTILNPLLIIFAYYKGRKR